MCRLSRAILRQPAISAADDIKTGTILSYVGSSSSATFFPDSVMTSDDDSHSIELKVLPNPHFAGCEPVSVQQGAGMVVTKGDEAEIKASVTFLKYFTAPENNIQFSIGSGYLPVTREANKEEMLADSEVAMTPEVKSVLQMAVKTVNENKLYTTRAFEGSKNARKVLEYAMSDLAVADRDTVEQRIAAGQSAEQAEAEFRQMHILTAGIGIRWRSFRHTKNKRNSSRDQV